MSKVLPALVGASMLGLVGVANAAEPESMKVLTSEELDTVRAGAVLVIGNQDHHPDRSYHSANATLDNDNAKRFFVITHNWGGLDNGPDGPLP